MEHLNKKRRTKYFDFTLSNSLVVKKVSATKLNHKIDSYCLFYDDSEKVDTLVLSFTKKSNLTVWNFHSDQTDTGLMRPSLRCVRRIECIEHANPQFITSIVNWREVVQGRDVTILLIGTSEEGEILATHGAESIGGVGSLQRHHNCLYWKDLADRSLMKTTFTISLDITDINITSIATENTHQHVTSLTSFRDAVNVEHLLVSRKSGIGGFVSGKEIKQLEDEECKNLAFVTYWNGCVAGVKTKLAGNNIVVLNLAGGVLTYKTKWFVAEPISSLAVWNGHLISAHSQMHEKDFTVFFGAWNHDGDLSASWKLCDGFQEAAISHLFTHSLRSYNTHEGKLLITVASDGHISLWKASVSWNIERLLWIAWSKNGENSSCLFPLLPKELVQYILSWLAAVLSASWNRSA